MCCLQWATGDKQDVTKICVLSHSSPSNAKSSLTSNLHQAGQAMKMEESRILKRLLTDSVFFGKGTSEEEYKHFDTIPK